MLIKLSTIHASDKFLLRNPNGQFKEQRHSARAMKVAWLQQLSVATPQVELTKACKQFISAARRS
jgi:hypothetical protein